MNRVALLMPVFQNALGVQKSLASLGAEVHLDIVLVDDGSTPPLAVTEVPAPHRLVLLRLPENKGLTEALNTGLRFVYENQYEYVARLDAGDLAIAGRFGLQVQYLDEHPEVALVGTAAQYVSQTGKPLFRHYLPQSQQAILRHLRRQTAFCHPSVMMRVEMIRSVGYYSSAYFAAEDYDYFFRVAEAHPTANLPQVLITKEVASNSVSMARRKRQLWSRLRIQLEHFRFGSATSYVGIAATFLFLLCPNALVIKGKQWLWGQRTA